MVPNTPRRANRREIISAEVRRAIHDPYLARAIGVFQNDIGFAISVEIACSGNFPGKRKRSETDASDKSRAIHQPNGSRAGSRVLKNKIGTTIAVEIARSGNVY